MSNQYTPVRHHYEDMPPYNYAGIDDQIDGSYYTGSYWNLLLAGGANQTQTQDVNTTTTTNSDSVRTMGEEVSVLVTLLLILDLWYNCSTSHLPDALQQTHDYWWRGSQVENITRGQ